MQLLRHEFQRCRVKNNTCRFIQGMLSVMTQINLLFICVLRQCQRAGSKNPVYVVKLTDQSIDNALPYHINQGTKQNRPAKQGLTVNTAMPQADDLRLTICCCMIQVKDGITLLHFKVFEVYKLKRYPGNIR